MMQQVKLVCAVVGLMGVGGLAVEDWWRDAVYYRLQVDSFKDNDGDGLGDLIGATKQLSYVRALGADAVILSPISARSTDCTKPGLLHHTDLDPRYGTLADFAALLEKAKKLEIKVVIELPLNTVSTASEWFVESDKSSSGLEHFMMWADEKPTETIPGIEWIAIGDKHYASRDQEALVNLCCDGVKAALSTMQCAWLRRGLAGVLINPDFEQDNNCAGNLMRHMSAAAVECARTSNLETPVILVESSLDPENASLYYSEGAKSVLSDALSGVMKKTAAELALSIYSETLFAPYELKPTWMTSRIMSGRTTTRFGADMVDTINLLALILPGAAIIQQGDELGAADGLLELIGPSEKCWPKKPLPALAPFPWDDSTNAGFSIEEPWMPVTPNYRYANAKIQFSSDTSHAGVVRLGAAMRKSPAFGSHVEITRLENAISVLRWGDTGSLLLVCNLGTNPTEAQPSRIPGIAPEMTVAASSATSNYAAESHILTDKIMKLNPGEAVLLAGAPRHCGGPGPVDKIATKLADGWQKINKYFGSL